MVKNKLEQRIIDALEALAPAHGVDIVDVEVTGATKAPCVRVRLDRLDGQAISLDEVTAQSRWVDAAVEELDPVAGSYTLEVSSPGMERPLRRPSDFARFVGEAVNLTTTATKGRRSYKGVIASATETEVVLDIEGEGAVSLPFDTVKKCVLKPVYDFKGLKEEE